MNWRLFRELLEGLQIKWTLAWAAITEFKDKRSEWSWDCEETEPAELGGDQLVITVSIYIKLAVCWSWDGEGGFGQLT
jgi:hypothetical protein